MNQEILSQLRDVHMPVEPALWPPPLRVLVLFLSLFLSLVFLIFIYIKGRKKRLLKKLILAELNSYNNQQLIKQDSALLQAQLSALLRRVLRIKNPRLEINHLPLDKLTGELKKLFPRSKNLPILLDNISQDRFHKENSIDSQKLLNLAFEHFKKCQL